MIKVGIVTICDRVPNYGNRLQNYAVKYVLESLGFSTVTYSFEERPLMVKDWVKKFFHRLTKYHFTHDRFIWTYEFRRRVAFSRFTKHYLRTKYNKSISDNLKKEQDYFVIGSDQVWNPSWYNDNPLKKDAYLLTFAEPKQKICFAPSFGVDEMPVEWRSWFKRNLSSFPSINVREQSGIEIVKELTGKSSVLMIDPTMMLSKQQWLNIAKKPIGVDANVPYILTYFIGGISNNARRIMESERKKGIIIYSLLDRDDLITYPSGPEEFIYLVSKAKMVLTDSFHASVFSILFDIPFLVFPREGKETKLMGRITTLLKCLNLEDRLITAVSSIDSYYNCDYTEVHCLIEEKRKMAIKYFKKAFSLDNNSFD